eukprot:8040386-Alexandrium_andersonii.AAC.1
MCIRDSPSKPALPEAACLRPSELPPRGRERPEEITARSRTQSPPSGVFQIAPGRVAARAI